MSMAGSRPPIRSATTRAEPQDRAQPLEPWPRFSQMPGLRLGPSTGGPSGSIGRAPFQALACDRRAAPGNQSSSTLYSVRSAASFMRPGAPPSSALPATRMRWPSREMATLYFSSMTAPRGPSDVGNSLWLSGAVTE